MSMKFKSDIEVQAGLRDSSGSLGTSGQILSSTSGNVSWVTPTVNTVASDVQNQVKAGVAINKGQAVYVTGADGTNIIVGLASNTSEATSSKTLGLLNATVATNGFADVVQIGRLAGLNTLGANAGDPVWLGTSGNLIYGLANKPYAPAHLVFLGIVTRVNSSNGEIFVNVQNGFELKEIHDVDIITNAPINGDVLGYDGTLWVNKTIAEWLGYTPANASGTTNYISKFTGTTSLGNSSIFDNGSAVGIFTSAPGFVTPGRGVLSLNGSSNSLMEFQAGGAFKSYLYQSGTNFEIYDTNAILFSVSGSERMRITSSGNVGIGTTTANYRTQIETTGADVFLTKNTSSTSFNRSYFYNNNNVGVQFLNFGSAYGFGTEFGVGQNGSVIQSNTTSAFAVGTSGAYPLLLGTTGSERMRIDSSGNILVGQTSPIYSATNRANLTIGKSAGSIIVLGTSTAANGYLFYNNTDLELANSTASGSVFFRTTGTERMRIASNGAIKFNAYGSGTFTGTATQKLAVDSSGNIIEIPIGAGPVDGSGTTNYVTKWTDSDTIGNSIMFDDGASVGVGTTTPAYPLEVNGAIVSKGGGTGGLDGTIGFGSTGTSLSGNALLGEMYFKTGGSEKMRINIAGNVGIGTSNPQGKLAVDGGSIRFNYGNGAAAYYLYLNHNSSHDGGMLLTRDNSTFDWQINNLGANGDLHFYSYGIGSPALVLQRSSGNVGIGTTNPGAKLVVYSGASVTDYASFATGDGSNTIQYIPYVGTGDYNNLSYGGGSLLFNNIGSRLTVGTHNGTAIQFGPTNTLISGNVGIGTTNPQRKLDIVGDHSTSTFRVYYPELNVAGQDASVDIWASEPGISFNGSGIGSNVNGQPYYGRTNPALGQGFIRFIDGTTAFHNSSTNAVYSERMRITPSGNVCIGTTSALHTLSVAGTIGGNTYGDSFVEFAGSGNTLVKANDNVILGYSQSTAIKQNGSVGIGTTTPDASAILQLDSTTQGFLLPRMGNTDMVNISSPAQGLMVFNTDNNVVCVYDGSTWQRLAYI